MYFVTTNIDGSIKALYSDDGDFAAPPAGALPVTSAEFSVLKGGMGGYKLVSGVVVDNLDMYKARQIRAIEEAYEAALDAPINYMSTQFQAEAESRMMISSVLVALGGASPIGFGWHDINNTRIAMTFAQLQGLATTILLRGDPLFQTKQARKASIRAAISKAEIEAVIW